MVSWNRKDSQVIYQLFCHQLRTWVIRMSSRYGAFWSEIDHVAFVMLTAHSERKSTLVPPGCKRRWSWRSIRYGVLVFKWCSGMFWYTEEKKQCKLKGPVLNFSTCSRRAYWMQTMLKHFFGLRRPLNKNYPRLSMLWVSAVLHIFLTRYENWLIPFTGYFLENGIGVEKNVELALKWYKLAAKQGDKRAAERMRHEKGEDDGKKGGLFGFFKK